jgi:hypothetical protein
MLAQKDFMFGGSRDGAERQWQSLGPSERPVSKKTPDKTSGVFS